MKVYKLAVFMLAAFIFASCNANQDLSETPTSVVKTYLEASKRQDVIASKKSFSKDTIKMYEDIAQKEQISVDEVLKKQFEYALAKNLVPKVETLGERIEGDTATVEIKNITTGESGSIPLVKEETVWKLALDRFLREMVRKRNEQMKNTAPPIPNGEPAESEKNTNAKTAKRSN